MGLGGGRRRVPRAAGERGAAGAAETRHGPAAAAQVPAPVRGHPGRGGGAAARRAAGAVRARAAAVRGRRVGEWRHVRRWRQRAAGGAGGGGDQEAEARRRGAGGAGARARRGRRGGALPAAAGRRRPPRAPTLVAAVEAAAAKRLRAKGEEIERIGRLNWALEERVKSLYVEAQVWRDLAQSNEAAANALRGELQQALDAQQARCGVVLAGDAESCCCGENDVGGGTGAGNEGEEDEAGTTSGRRMCTMCGEGAAEVLLLPCRHLCACAPCAGAARACSACGCAKNGSVCVNFS
ncbi:hypothetical protein PAHAL_3G449000 [Panicum hallii]|uniref:RING-type domain-containing protein n=1 Tax=Panicum hallii TaxID=206008 RepID=A0A2T8KLD0_9POAL|nr:hypothetical protein PAHAL_3G449000 [Panicum hallii]